MARALAAGVSTWAARRAARARPAAPTVPTLVVGGLAVGGAGKTPVVRLLAEHAAGRGLHVAVVARGYGGSAARRGSIEEVHAPDARAFGDEAALLRRVLPAGVRVLVGRDRRGCVARAAARADLVLIDDGFQDPDLPRSADLVVVDATAARAVLPAGPLREPTAALARADLGWLHRWDEPGARELAGCAVRSVVRPTALRGPRGEPLPAAWLAGRAVAAVCGLGRPDSFRHTLARCGADVRHWAAFVDHHRFRPRELAPLERTGLPVVTTEKDAERLPPGFPAWVLETRVEVVAGWPAVQGLLARLGVPP